MRITGPDGLPDPKTPYLSPGTYRPVHSSANVTDPAATTSARDTGASSQSMDARLARIFGARGAFVSAGELTTLGTNLSSLGISPADIGPENALRALLLSRHGVTLRPELIVAGNDSGMHVFDRVTAMRDTVDHLLSRPGLTQGQRGALESFAAGFDGLMQSGAGTRLLGEELRDAVMLWSLSLRERLLRLAAGAPLDMDRISPGEGLTARGMLEGLLRGADEGDAPAGMAAILGVIDRSSAQTSARLLSLLDRPGASMEQMRAVLAGLGSVLGSEAPGVETLLAALGKTPPDGAVAALFAEEVRALERAVKRSLTGSGWPGVIDDDVDGSVSRTALRSGGMMFEWRLLAWYRAGGDPARLREMAGGDLKGLLTIHARRFEDEGGHGRHGRAIRTLGTEARAAIGDITGRQVDSVLNPARSRGSIVVGLEMPVPPGMGAPSTQVRVGGDRKGKDDAGGPGHARIAMDLDLSELGTVGIVMTDAGGTLSLAFTVGDDDIVADMKNASRELVESMAARGIPVGSVVVRTRDGDSGNDGPGAEGHGGGSAALDVRG